MRTNVFFCRTLSHFDVGSVFLMGCLHLTRSCASSPDSYISDKSFLVLSYHTRFHLSLLLFPGNAIIITCLSTHYSLLNACPYHFNLLFCTFLLFLPYSLYLYLFHSSFAPATGTNAINGVLGFHVCPMILLHLLCLHLYINLHWMHFFQRRRIAYLCSILFYIKMDSIMFRVVPMTPSNGCRHTQMKTTKEKRHLK